MDFLRVYWVKTAEHIKERLYSVCSLFNFIRTLFILILIDDQQGAKLMEEDTFEEGVEILWREMDVRFKLSNTSKGRKCAQKLACLGDIKIWE